MFAFDALARHASADERRQLMREHRLPLLAMGVMSGYLGAAPALLWAVGAPALVLAPLLLVVSVWLYTLVFAFAAAWFTHYALAALQRLRDASDVLEPPTVVPAAAAHPTPALQPAAPGPTMNIGLIIIGDEILSGKRRDAHLPKVHRDCSAHAACRWPGRATKATTARASRGR